jgi:hypothetical protein
MFKEWNDFLGDPRGKRVQTDTPRIPGAAGVIFPFTKAERNGNSIATTPVCD